MNLKSLSDPELLKETKSLVSDERNLTARILEYLKEIDIRKIYLPMGFSSLHAFCVGFLGYEDHQAYRRILACRLLKDLPEIQDKIESGSLTLTAIAQAQTYFRQSKIDSMDQKLEVLSTLEGKSTRQCERLLIELNPKLIPQAVKIRELTKDHVELKIVLPRETIEKLNRIKELKSHSKESLVEIIDSLASQFLKAKDPLQKSDKPTAQYEAVGRRVPESTRVQVFKRDQGRCQYRDPLTKKICNSRYQVQIDHRIPYSIQQNHDPENLRLLCRSHNLYMATKLIGKTVMAKYIEI